MSTFYANGTYHAQVMDVAFGEAKTGNPQIVLRVKIISGLVKGSDGEELSVSVSGQYDRTIYLTVTEKSKEMVLTKLRWAGWTGDKFESLTTDLVGRGVRATCAIEESKSEKYLGQPTEKWDLELPPLESKPLENKPAIAKKLNALFGKSLKENGKPKPSPAHAAAVAAQAPHETVSAGVAKVLDGPATPDDEIPF